MYGRSPDPGRGVYLARRIVAAIVVVLLLVLVVPRACQAFLGPEEETSSVEPEKSATQEETIGETEAVPAVEGGTTGEEVSAVEEAAQGAYVAEAEAAEIQRDLQAPQGQGYIIGEVNQTAPAAVPSLGAIQPAVQSLPPRQPISSAEPPVVPEPILPAEPPVMAEPILPVEPPVVAGPALPTEPPPIVVEAALPVEPILLDQAHFFEEEEPPFFKEKQPVSEGTFSGETTAAAPEQKTVAVSGGGSAIAVAGSVRASALST